MARQSVGEFITTLRKAKGMTQKQLAERLNVSDKTVSRWERGESAPDISLIPVIAEVFDVTCDEILRGERIQEKEIPIHSAKKEKQFEYLIQKVQNRFLIQNLIVIGIAIVGLISSVFVKNRKYDLTYAFYVGILFFIVAFVCEIIFVILAFNSIKCKELESDLLNQAKKKLYSRSKISFVLLVLMFSLIMPYLYYFIVGTFNPYQEVMYSTISGYIYRFIAWSTSSVIVSVLLSVLFSNITIVLLDYIISKKKFICFSEKEEVVFKKKMKSALILVASFGALLTITYGSGIVFINNNSEMAFMEGTEFRNIAEFEEFMGIVTYNYETLPYTCLNDSKYKEYHANLLTGEIRAKDGTIISDFEHNNMKVFGIDVKWENESPVIKTYSMDDYKDANLKLMQICRVWEYLLLVEVVLFALVLVINYYRK